MKRAYYVDESDILMIDKGFDRGEKFDGNLVVGDLVLDMSTKGRIRGVEILNASRYLKEFVSGDDLLQLKDANFTANVHPEGILLTITLKTKKETVPAKIAVPMEMTAY